MSRTELATALRAANIVYHEPVTLRSGLVSEYYVDVKKAYGDPVLLNMMARAVSVGLDARTSSVAAAGYGGIPLGVEVSRETGLPLTMVRDVEKSHGMRGMVDGYVPGPEDTVSLVDDVYTSGSSLRHTAGTLGHFGLQIVGCHVVVARADTSAFEWPVSHVFVPEDIVAASE